MRDQNEQGEQNRFHLQRLQVQRSGQLRRCTKNQHKQILHNHDPAIMPKRADWFGGSARFRDQTRREVHAQRRGDDKGRPPDEFIFAAHLGNQTHHAGNQERQANTAGQRAGFVMIQPVLVELHHSPPQTDQSKTGSRHNSIKCIEAHLSSFRIMDWLPSASITREARSRWDRLRDIPYNFYLVFSLLIIIISTFTSRSREGI
jgi:hypothetical protein